MWFWGWASRGRSPPARETGRGLGHFCQLRGGEKEHSSEEAAALPPPLCWPWVFACSSAPGRLGIPGCLGPQHRRHPLTFGILPAQLPLLYEASKCLGLHEDLQETAEALGGDSFAEGLALQGPLLALTHRQEQGVVAHDLHEEADKGFRHHLVQGAALRACATRGRARPGEGGRPSLWDKRISSTSK